MEREKQKKERKAVAGAKEGERAGGGEKERAKQKKEREAPGGQWGAITLNLFSFSIQECLIFDIFNPSGTVFSSATDPSPRRPLLPSLLSPLYHTPSPL